MPSTNTILIVLIIANAIFCVRGIYLDKPVSIVMNGAAMLCCLFVLLSRVD